MWEFLFESNENPELRDEARLSDEQVRALADGKGCVQCGRKARGYRHRWLCCGDAKCRAALDVIHGSHLLSKRLLARRN